LCLVLNQSERSTRTIVPELPEVEYVRRMLRRAMEGQRIERVVTRRPNLRYPFGDDFTARLEGQVVRAVTRRAKYLLLELASRDALVMHLGMSGWFRVARGGREPLETHDHVVFEMSSGAWVIFSDARRFGFMKILGRAAVSADAALGALGPEPLDRRFDARVLAESLGRRKTSLKVALLDQRVIAGVGNIYGLSPKRRASTLVTRSGEPRPEAHALVGGIRDALTHAIANRHRDASSDRFRVYERDGKRCPRRGCRGVIRRIVQTGRSTFFCPVCQR
jgi:formamidopyrimidine-DNA glycosylase